jgi:glucose/arabinose dehydrogenase
MAVAPNGDLLVSHPGSGRVYLLRTNAGGDPALSVFASGLRTPHDLVFAAVGGQTWLYVAESHQIIRFRYQVGDAVASGGQVVVAGLPDASNPELKGTYGHQLKNIAVSAAGQLYVSIASMTNASESDAISNPLRCAIYRYNADGTGGRLFARGLRNAEGLAFVPGTSVLWVTVNARDNIRVPHHRDWDGDGSDDYGKLIPAYVDNHPPEPFTRVVDGGNYGWPYANPNPDTPSGMTNMPFDPDYDNNRDWTRFPASTFTRISRGIQAHSAPLGFSFLQASAVPVAYRNGAAIALHGSWNRTRRTGYKVIYFPWQADGTPGNEIDLVRGWLDDSTQTAWGRPVDVVPDLAGNLFISDDHSGTIYKLAPQSVSSKSPPIVSLTQPANGAILSTTFTITASASAPNGSIARVEFWQGPNKLGEKYTAPYTWAVYGATPGVYTGIWGLKAKAVDTSGAATTSNSVDFTVTSAANKPPTAALIAPAHGATLPPNFTMTATASDPDGHVQRVEFWQGPNKLGEVRTPPYIFHVYGGTPLVYTGQWGLRVVAVDDKGAATTSNSVDFTVVAPK